MVRSSELLRANLADHAGHRATAQRFLHRPGAVALMRRGEADQSRHGQAEQFESRPVKMAGFELSGLGLDPQHRTAIGCARAGEKREREGGGGAEVEWRGRRNLVQGAERKPAAERAVERGDAKSQRPFCGTPCALRLDHRHSVPERVQDEWSFALIHGHNHARAWPSPAILSLLRGKARMPAQARGMTPPRRRAGHAAAAEARRGHNAPSMACMAKFLPRRVFLLCSYRFRLVGQFARTFFEGARDIAKAEHFQASRVVALTL